ncbi:hypothetical protein Glove_213g55 [Diversispora epigaea]|uniref:SPX domain-containing protein n=1 Tax=Diversispora epigaea TaxID=1348612 RepID=A0A397IMM4_9GLOM|nr:hypothetical protein Glove_213g55 [Diversispora epigaea]
MDFSKAYKKIINFLHLLLELADEVMNYIHKKYLAYKNYVQMIEFEKKYRSTSPLSKFIPTIGRKMEKILLAQFG